MKKLYALSVLLGIALLALGTIPSLIAQAPAPGTTANQDIQKMIQAGLPESVILNKIREGAGRWDTSVDALIALKGVGATEAELAAMTAVDAPAVPASSEAAGPPVSIFDGQLMRTQAGDPYIQFSSNRPDYFPNGLPTNTAFLVLYKGEVGVLVPSSEIVYDCNPYNVVFQKNRVIVQQYVQDGCTMKPWQNAKTVKRFALKEYPREGVILERNKQGGFLSNGDLGKLHVPYDTLKLTKKRQTRQDWIDFLFGMYPFNYIDEPAAPMHSVDMEPFVSLLFSDFDSTVAEFEHAANITDPATQLSPQANFRAMTQAEIDRYNAIATQRQSERKSNGNGWLSALNALQGVANIQQSMQDAKAADLTHNTAGQMRAVVNATTAEMQTLGAVSGNTTMIQPLAPASSTQTQPPAAQMRPNAVATPKKATGFTYNVSHGQPANSSAASNNIASSAQPKASPNPGGKPSGVNTGTAAPPSCVYLSDAQPCVPLAQYQQMQAQQQASGQGICPASGFVPGVMLRQASDVAVGVPCKPGTPYGPLIATTASGGYTGVTPPDPASAGPSGSGSGSSVTGGSFDPSLNDCVVYFYKNDPITGDHLILRNNCSVRARVWFYASSQVYGAESLNPGEAGNTYAGHDKILAAGVLSIYACPVDDVPRKADGTQASNGVNNRFRCSRK
jgi:hypothetical protein